MKTKVIKLEDISHIMDKITTGLKSLNDQGAYFMTPEVIALLKIRYNDAVAKKSFEVDIEEESDDLR